ncbi:MAG: DoxX family protein [Candidatus Thiosymbion ectosymbiont of Robbea hypermnestra]|nr:DoxX family protein [Candidatus Thiosymbion ectosymbiont of Robbea hypermnestra]
MIRLLDKLQDTLDALRAIDFLGPLALRLYLAPVFWVAGTNKLANFEDTATWFGNPDRGLGLPMPELMVGLAAGTEVIGAILLVIGFAVRWISLPLMVTMLVAAVTAHWENGWQAVADNSSAFASERLGIFRFEDAGGATERLNSAREIIEDFGNYDWLTSEGEFVIANNGMEWAATYFVMLLVLFFIGAGKYASIDYWIARRFRRIDRRAP